MKALVLKAYGKLALEEVPEPAMAEDEVLVRVKACGICGSDVHGLDGSTGRRKPPLIMGHEAAGVVAAAGPRASGWAAGDRVTFDSTVFCGECWFCRRGRANLCDNRRVLGVSCDEYRQDGAFAEYVAIPSRILHRLPEGVSFAHAAMVEALSVAVHAVGMTPLLLGETAVVVGAGPIGLLVVQALRAAGCGRVVAVDIDADRLALARRLGADECLQPGARGAPADATGLRVRELTGGRGAEAAFEVVGNTHALSTAVSCVRKGGSVTLVGNFSPSVELGLQAAVTREITLRGSCASCGEYPVCLDMIARKEIDPAALISAVAPLADGPAWFARLAGKEKGLMKVILTP